MDGQQTENNHSKYYKNMGKSFENIRRDRQTNSIELRKSRRDDMIQKKRNMCATVSPPELFNNTAPLNPDQVRSLVEACSSSDPNIYEQAVYQLRLYLTLENVPYINELLQTPIIAILASRLSTNESVDVRYNAAWALTNIASGPSDQTSFLLKENIICAIASLLTLPYPQLVEQGIWCLSNIMGDGPHCRSFVLSLNLLSCLGQVLSANAQHLSLVKQFSWMMINVCRKKDVEVEPHYLSLIIPILSSLLGFKDESVISDSLWAVTHLADSSADHITAMIQGGIISKVLHFCNASVKLSLSSLRALGNVAASIDEHTQYLLDHQIYTYLRPLFSSHDQKVKKEVYWLLSNIAAGTRAQMLTLFEVDIFGQVLHDLEFGEYQIQREAGWIVSNVIHNCTAAELQPFIDGRIVTLLNKFLKSSDVSMIIVVLEVFVIILRLYSTSGKLEYICNKFEESGAVDSVEALQTHQNKTIYGFTTHILERFFCEDDTPACNNSVGVAPSSIQEDSNSSQFNENSYDF